MFLQSPDQASLIPADSCTEVHGLDEGFLFIHASLIRRQKSISMGFDALALASPVPRKRSFHFRCCDELFRLDGIVPNPSTSAGGK